MSKQSEVKFNQFELDLDRLESIVGQMRDEKLPLGQAIELFEQGIELTKRCEQTLQLAKQRIQALDVEKTPT